MLSSVLKFSPRQMCFLHEGTKQHLTDAVCCFMITLLITRGFEILHHASDVCCCHQFYYR